MTYSPGSSKQLFWGQGELWWSKIVTADSPLTFAQMVLYLYIARNIRSQWQFKAILKVRLQVHPSASPSVHPDLMTNTALQRSKCSVERTNGNS